MQSLESSLRARVSPCLALLFAACAVLPHGPYEPAPLRGPARQLMRDMLAASPSPAQPSVATAADGARVPYDRYCLIGSEFASDRTRAYFAFVDDLRRLGGDFAALEHDRDGRATKILVDVDGQRIVVTYLRW
jgi:hypothetical protein